MILAVLDSVVVLVSSGVSYDIDYVGFDGGIGCEGFVCD